jgi:uncharacterized circularly permuted ATP-grasp superfamily protein
MVAAFDEMQGRDGAVRPAYGELARWLADVPPDVLDYRRREAELIFRRIGHHLRRLRRGRRAGAADPLRRHPAHHVRRRHKRATIEMFANTNWKLRRRRRAG